MALFAKKQSYLGIDLGTASVKIVELSNMGGQAKLETYGFAELPVESVSFNVHDKIDRTARTVAEICRQANIQSRKAIAALPTFAVFSSVLTLPVMNEREVGQALSYEAKKIVPIPLEEMILDWKILHDKEEETEEPADKTKSKVTFFARKEKSTRVLLTAAPKSLVKQYLEIFSQANIELISLETEAFALGRALLSSDKGVVVILDVGALTTDIVIVEDRIPVLNRSVDVGGVTVTKAIATSLNLELNRAEQFKRDVGIIKDTGEGGVPNIIRDTISPVINELKYSISLYQAESAHNIEKIVITGGSGFLPNFPEYLESIFQLKTIVGDPWQSVSYPVELKGVLDEIGPRFATAIGLALREIHK